MEQERMSGLAIAGYVLAVMLPLIGMVIGVILNRRGDRHGIRILWVATVVIALGLLIRATLY